MSYVRIWIHTVFSTKNRDPILDKESLNILCIHIRGNCREKGIYIDHINGHYDHIHVLISLDKKQNIADVMQQIKGESSFWMNKEKILKNKLAWQDDYFTVSIGQSQVEAVRNYIAGQEEHHRKKTFTEEVDEFMKKYGWQYVQEDKNM